MSRVLIAGGWAGMVLMLSAGLCRAQVESQAPETPKADATPQPALFLPVDPMPTDMEARIEGALETATELEFIDTPLADAVNFVADVHQVPVMIDVGGLEEAGLRGDAPVTISIKGIRLRSALRLMLDELHLTYTVHNEVLMITTPAAAKAMAATKIYDVSKILGLGEAAEDLARLLHDTLAVERDADTGYQSLRMTPEQTLASLETDGATSGRRITAYQQMLVVRDTTTGHERIADILRGLQASAIRRAIELQRAQAEAMRATTQPEESEEGDAEDGANPPMNNPPLDERRGNA